MCLRLADCVLFHAQDATNTHDSPLQRVDDFISRVSAALDSGGARGRNIMCEHRHQYASHVSFHELRDAESSRHLTPHISHLTPHFSGSQLAMIFNGKQRLSRSACGMSSSML